MKQQRPNRWRRVLTLSMWTLLLLSAPARLHAQQENAVLTGTVLDPHGNVLPNASVTVKNEATGAVRKLTGDAEGHFSAGLPAGKYTVQATAPGFAATVRRGVQLSAAQPQDLSLPLTVAAAVDQVTVEANATGSIAAQLAPLQAQLDARSAQTEISAAFIQNFTSPVSDFSELIQMAPGTFSVNSNGVGLGDGKTYFRGFKDGNYDITFDGIPFNDTNDVSHHSWAFFPSQWIGGVDYDRSPGSAATIGPAPFGGSINLLSKEMSPEQNIRGGVSYGSFNTLLIDGQYDSGNFGGASRRSNVLIDIHRLTSDGYQTYNYQTRNAGSLKYQFKISDKTLLTGFSGVIILDSNTPDFGSPRRDQIAQFGLNFLMNNDPTSPFYYKYNFYHVPTDFEYVGVKSELGHGWKLDVKPYTYSYYNKQNLTKPKATVTPIDDSCGKGKFACAVDKLNSYRKYGETLAVSQTSKFGIFRTGLWYEWAATDRFQYPSDPRTWTDTVLPNFHEKFWTNSYQPYAEYQYQATSKLSITGGIKLAYYNQDLKQYADNGKTVGNLGGAAFTRRSGGYTSWLPSADVNYRLKPNWSVYGQFASGSIIPPSGVFDVTGTVTLLPKPTTTKTYQGGSVLKLRRVTLDLDAYYTRFQNAYTGSPDPSLSTGTQYTANGEVVTKGFEAETNVFITHGLSLYVNGTAGTARYASQTINGVVNPNYNRWVATTPANTEAIGLTYQQKYVDLGIFNKRVGPMWNDNSLASGATANQVIPIDPFNVTNAFVNYTVRNGSHLDQTKVRLSVNNMFDQHNFVGVSQTATGATVSPGPSDLIKLLPGRSVMLSVTFGYAPNR